MIDLIAIGASMGGLNAVLRLLKPLDRGFPLPIALVQHRGLEGDDSYASLLRRELALTVAEVEDKEPMVGGRVHVAPADYHLLVDGHRFALSTDARVNSARPSIDVLFQSAAHACRDRLLAVLLTGRGVDGMNGARKVHERGGQVVVQDPSEAEEPSMPSSALPWAARVLPLDEIGRYLRVVAAERHL